MSIRVANRLWREGSEGLGLLLSHPLSSTFERRSITKFTQFGRSTSTDTKNHWEYDEKRDYSSEMTVPSLKYGTQVVSFGAGSNGALGLDNQGYLSDIYAPEPVQGLPTNIMRVAAGHYHSLAITEDGEVWAWGRNSEGQLGPRDENSRQTWSKPQKVKGLENVSIKEVAGSGVISMALAQDGSLWSWGSSERGQLGLGPDLVQSNTPQKVEALAGQHVSQISLGWGHALACTTEGKLYAWGYPADGRLGFEREQLGNSQVETAQRSRSLSRPKAIESAEIKVQEKLRAEQTVVPVWTPQFVEALASQKVTTVACGMDHSLALADSGDLYSFGRNSLGQLGRRPSKELVGIVKFPDGKNKVIGIAAGLAHSLALALDPCSEFASPLPSHLPPGLTKPLTTWEKETREAIQGSLFSWGWNSGGQLGRTGDPNLPGLVDGFGKERLVRLVAGRVHSGGLNSERQVWMWGSGRNGRLGLGNSNDEQCPVPLEGLGFWRVLQIACGFDHSLILVRTVGHFPCTGTM